jgi:hypothetical protein
MLNYLIIIFLYINSLVSFSQSLTGTISDTLKNPLESANVIAKPIQEKQI